ncbi:hypothetical protein ACM66B_004642 [Microbotryomycetes sp. NB124-2]
MAPRVGLSHLPEAALRRTVAFVLQDEPNAAVTLLTQCGRLISHVTRAYLYERVALEDDDAVLVAASDDRYGAWTSQLRIVMHNDEAASLVKHLAIVPACTVPSSSTAAGSAMVTPETSRVQLDPSSDDDTDHSDAQLHHLDDKGLLMVLSRLENLSRFDWNAPRLPRFSLPKALEVATPQLLEFRFDMRDGLGEPPGFTSQLRWDAGSLSSLPVSLTTLELSGLTSAGIRSLETALTALRNLEYLDIHHTPFVDDALLEETGASAHKLRHLRVGDMQGTKLTDDGIVKLLQASESLEKFELDCVEGRLTKQCWAKVTEAPDTLQELVLRYSEAGPHKSWTLDHIASLHSVLSIPSLVKLTIARRIEPACLEFGRLDNVKNPIDPLMAGVQCPKVLLEALQTTGLRWHAMDLSLFELDLEDLKTIMDSCTNLTSLSALLAADLKSVLSLTASFGSCARLKHFGVSVAPSHMPAMGRTGFKSFGHGTQLPMTPQSSPESQRPSLAFPEIVEAPLSPPQIHSRRSSASGSSALHPALESFVPATKDWRKFLRKTQSLESFAWTGRGGVGTWRFQRRGGVSAVSIELESVALDTGPLSFAQQPKANLPREYEVDLDNTCFEFVDWQESQDKASSPSPSFSPQSPQSPARSARGTSSATAIKNRPLNFGTTLGLGLTGVPAATPFNSPSQPSAGKGASKAAPIVFPGGWHTPKQRPSGGKKKKAGHKTQATSTQQPQTAAKDASFSPVHQAAQPQDSDDSAQQSTRESIQDTLWECERAEHSNAVSAAAPAWATPSAVGDSGNGRPLASEVLMRPAAIRQARKVTTATTTTEQQTSGKTASALNSKDFNATKSLPNKPKCEPGSPTKQGGTKTQEDKSSGRTHGTGDGNTNKTGRGGHGHTRSGHKKK